MTLVHSGKRITLALAGVAALAITAHAADAFDPASQIGANPVLPEPQQYLFPPMKLAPVVGWKDGETPTVPSGLKIEAARDRPLPSALAHRAAEWRRAGR